MSDRDDSPTIVEIMRVVWRSHHVEILETLSDGPRDVTTLAELLDLGLDSVSHALARLRLVGLVEYEAESRRRIYRLGPSVRSAKRTASQVIIEIKDLDGCRVEITLPTGDD